MLAFLEAGADKLARTWTWDRSVFGRGSGQTPLHWAAESGHAGVVDILLTHTPTSASGMRASDNNVIPHLELLLAAVPDERGHTPADVRGWQYLHVIRSLLCTASVVFAKANASFHFSS